MAFRKDNNTNKPKSFTKIAIGLASPEEILEHSSGQVLKPGTMKSSRELRSIWRRNRKPKPFPSLAPGKTQKKIFRTWQTKKQQKKLQNISPA